MASTLEKYLDQIFQATDPTGIYAYRGQSNSEWPLHSAATRRLVNEYDDTITADPRFSELYVEYHSAALVEPARSRGYAIEAGRTLNVLELLAKLQHFGAATGLLDFSWSPLVALWFACQDTQKDGKLFLANTGDPIRVANLHSESLAQSLSDIFTDQVTNSRIWYWEPPSSGDPAARIIRQRSVFMIGRPLLDIDQVVTKALFIEKADKLHLLSELEALDFHHESLFLDVYGFAQSSYNRRIPDFTADAHTRRANRFYQQGRHEEAIGQYGKALALVPQAALLHFLRGNVLATGGRYSEALDDYCEAVNGIDSIPVDDRSSVYYNRGNAKLELRDPLGAIADYTQAIATNPVKSECYYNRGNVYSDISRFAEASADYDKATGRSAAHAAFNKGNALLAMGRLREALDCYIYAGTKGADPAAVHQNTWVLQQILSAFDRLQYEAEPAPVPYGNGIHLQVLVPKADMERDFGQTHFIVYGRAGNTGNAGGPGQTGGIGYPGKPLTSLQIHPQAELEIPQGN